MNNKSIGEIIKYLRQSNNLSQKDVADALNLSVSAISQYETGKRNLSANEIILFSDYFHVSCDYLLGKEEVNTNDLLEKKLKLSYEITLKSTKYRTTIFEKFLTGLFYLSAIVLIFIPQSKFLFSFCIIIQLIFVIFMISKRFITTHNSSKKIFTIPDDVSVFYEYKRSNTEFASLSPLKDTLIITLTVLTVITGVVSIFIFPYYQNHSSYILLLMLLVSYLICVFYETCYYSRKMKIYRKIDYFDYGGYLQKTLSSLIEITSYFLLLIYIIIYLQTGIVNALLIIFGILLILCQMISHLYSWLIKHVLRSYELYAMLNDTLEIKKLS